MGFQGGLRRFQASSEGMRRLSAGFIVLKEGFRDV